jgi:hypothetical protein
MGLINIFPLSKANIVIVRVRGGLGNQLFIYAFARFLSLNLQCMVLLETRTGFIRDSYKRKYLLNNFNIQLKKCPWYLSIYFPFRNRLRTFTKLIYGDALYMDEIEFNKDLEHSLNRIKKTKTTFLDGYFQDKTYISNYRKIIIEDLSLKIRVKPRDQKILNEIILCNSVAIHLRRVEYNTLLELDYYIEAIRKIKEQIKDPVFYIFSDDIEWCKQNFFYDGSFILMENNRNNEIVDFWMMCHCKHFIIANSTYSWWGAWLSTNTEKIVIIP